MNNIMMNAVTCHIEEVGINKAFARWRMTLNLTCAPSNGPATQGRMERDWGLRDIVEHEDSRRREGADHSLTCIWTIIEGDVDKVKECAEWVRGECLTHDSMLFDFMTTDDENAEFLDGSLSLVIPGVWEPSGLLDYLPGLVSRFGHLTFWGSALEFRSGGSEPRSGSKFIGLGGRFWSDGRPFGRPYNRHKAA